METLTKYFKTTNLELLNRKIYEKLEKNCQHINNSIKTHLLLALKECTSQYANEIDWSTTFSCFTISTDMYHDPPYNICENFAINQLIYLNKVNTIKISKLVDELNLNVSTESNKLCLILNSLFHISKNETNDTKKFNPITLQTLISLFILINNSRLCRKLAKLIVTINCWSIHTQGTLVHLIMKIVQLLNWKNKIKPKHDYIFKQLLRESIINKQKNYFRLNEIVIFSHIFKLTNKFINFKISILSIIQHGSNFNMENFKITLCQNLQFLKCLKIHVSPELHRVRLNEFSRLNIDKIFLFCLDYDKIKIDTINEFKDEFSKLNLPLLYIQQINLILLIICQHVLKFNDFMGSKSSDFEKFLSFNFDEMNTFLCKNFALNSNFTPKIEISENLIILSQKAFGKHFLDCHSLVNYQNFKYIFHFDVFIKNNAMYIPIFTFNLPGQFSGVSRITRLLFCNFFYKKPNLILDIIDKYEYANLDFTSCGLYDVFSRILKILNCNYFSLCCVPFNFNFAAIHVNIIDTFNFIDLEVYTTLYGSVSKIDVNLKRFYNSVFIYMYKSKLYSGNYTTIQFILQIMINMAIPSNSIENYKLISQYIWKSQYIEIIIKKGYLFTLIYTVQIIQYKYLYRIPKSMSIFNFFLKTVFCLSKLVYNPFEIGEIVRVYNSSVYKKCPFKMRTIMSITFILSKSKTTSHIMRQIIKYLSNVVVLCVRKRYLGVSFMATKCLFTLINNVYITCTFTKHPYLSCELQKTQQLKKKNITTSCPVSLTGYDAVNIKFVYISKVFAETTPLLLSKNSLFFNSWLKYQNTTQNTCILYTLPEHFNYMAFKCIIYLINSKVNVNEVFTRSAFPLKFGEYNYSTILHKNLRTNGQVLKRILALKHNKVIKPFRLIFTEIEKIGIMSGLNFVLVDRMESKLKELWNNYRNAKRRINSSGFYLFKSKIKILFKFYKDDQSITFKEDLEFFKMQKKIHLV
ncbi:hypothetical protein A3Q56_00977 [Intoshia linei]|uniref:Uncharacterized protein n=1 Tax=Intoshia linei TaxID=1819745 RepID=A0A177BCL9_9BILA|nr:hypothetical protein A3Q56_00977 [Intoshia linei]